ncbi:hypothetical protein HDF24_14655 [Mucilaginibacter sp. X4EP1]|uniref:hypothetical protein n=1 Tax=Mucilaginibacter sp. X4EP1 TaxID=2723092 RepID=UPI002166FA32|nr:hypothetical protein [Mucilaginibacter sp. X4EP1]
MSKTSETDISKLNLDLKNYRTTPQHTEVDAINAMINIKQDRFYAVMESIIDDGYLPTENIIVLNDGAKMIVREGNRRIAAMKLIHGIYKIDDFALPNSLKAKILKLDAQWKSENKKVPCSIYNLKEEAKVEKIVALSHAKGEKAARDPWSSVARARYDRDTKKAVVPALDILEKYLIQGKNLTGMQKDRWAGEYPLTVLDEAIRKIYNRFDVASTTELATNYPKINYLTELEDIIRDIGIEQLETRQIRNTDNGNDFAIAYGIKPLVSSPAATDSGTTQSDGSGTASGANTAGAATTNTNANGTGGGAQGQQNNQQQGSAGGASNNTNSTANSTATKSYAINDPKHVSALLKKFTPKGNDRQKVVSLRDELKKLKIVDNPIAFCLLVRSIFEISAKVYSIENSISLTKVNGNKTIDKTLAELLKEITKKLTSNSTNTGMSKVLYGASNEMSQPNKILSVTSMNQMVHNTTFSVIPSDICTSFGNIYPLLEAMNS